MEIRKPHLILKLHLPTVTKNTPMQNHDHKNFTCKDLWAHAGLRIYAIMLPSSEFLVPHYNVVELAWHSGNVIDCHVTARGLIPGGNGVFTELHVLHKGQ